jgi:hypothetical protein
VAQLRLTRADCQRAASATPSANGSVVRSTMPKDYGQHGLWAVRQCQFMALFGRGPMSDVSPLSGVKRKTSTPSEYFAF